MYHFQKGTEYWFIYGGNGVQQLVYNIYTRILKQELLEGQSPLPEDFLQLIKQEFDNIQDSCKNVFNKGDI